MEKKALFSAILGIFPPWQVTAVDFAKTSNRVDICIEIEQGSPLVCPACGAHEAVCQGDSNIETWYRGDFFRYAAYLHVQVPQLACRCFIFPLERPWFRTGSKFVRVP